MLFQLNFQKVNLPFNCGGYWWFGIKLNRLPVAEFPPRLSYFAKNLGNRTVDLFNH